MRTLLPIALMLALGLATPALAQAPELPGNPFLPEGTPGFPEAPSGPGGTPGFPSTPAAPRGAPGFPTRPGGPGGAPELPASPAQVPLDGGLGLLALAGAAYAARRLRR